MNGLINAISEFDKNKQNYLEKKQNKQVKEKYIGECYERIYSLLEKTDLNTKLQEFCSEVLVMIEETLGTKKSHSLNYHSEKQVASINDVDCDLGEDEDMLLDLYTYHAMDQYGDLKLNNISDDEAFETATENLAKLISKYDHYAHSDSPNEIFNDNFYPTEWGIDFEKWNDIYSDDGFREWR